MGWVRPGKAMQSGQYGGRPEAARGGSVQGNKNFLNSGPKTRTRTSHNFPDEKGESKNCPRGLGYLEPEAQHGCRGKSRYRDKEKQSREEGRLYWEWKKRKEENDKSGKAGVNPSGGVRKEI